MKRWEIPNTITNTTKTLEDKGFQAFLVGGCVRDLIMGRKPKDWDIATDATPEKIQDIFSKTFYNNKFGTVTVVDEGVRDVTLKNIEITPFRIEEGYSDKRHPDIVKFRTNLEDDLKRRDFTINAVAYSPSAERIVDPHEGQSDIEKKTIRAVEDSGQKFNEDALRMMRAVRLATELGFTIETSTGEAITKNAALIHQIAAERISDELSKIVMSDEPKEGFLLLESFGLLEHIVPELREGIGIAQNQAHSYEVFDHNLRCLQHAAKRDWPLHIRLGALFHDIAKPATRVWGEKGDWTFYGHDVVGAKMTKKIMKRLRYGTDLTETVTTLVRYHLFFSDVDKITMSAVRRLIRNVGKDLIWDLMKVRACDRIGTGRPKEAPYRLRKFESMIEEALQDPVSVAMLKIKGEAIMRTTQLAPGPKIGAILHALLEEVLDDPTLNTQGHLEKRAGELVKLSDDELEKLGSRGKEKKESIETEKVKEIRKRHFVE